MTFRFLFSAFCLLLAVPRGADAQNSVLSVHGIGFPTQPLSVRARALAGGGALFDRLSAVNPAMAAAHTRVTAVGVMGTEFRGYDVGATSVDDLQNTRFPLVLVGGPAGARFGYTVSFAEYADRSFDIATTDTLMLRGEELIVQDRVRSDGGIADIRGAVGWAPHRTIRLGGALHVISGSTRLQVRRTFSDSAFREYRQDNEAGFSGFGVSVGAHVTPVPGLELAAVARIDGDLDGTLDSLPQGSVALPVTLGGGVQAVPHPAIRVSLAGQWRSWSDAGADLPASSAGFDTWHVAGGLELGGTGASRVPLRVGVRYATLPFAPAGSEQPHELVVAGGTGLPFARGRATIDLALERIFRDGAGFSERAWLFTMGISVRP